jgi:hypothetical protein
MVFNIDPKFNVGDIFWVPRVYRNTVQRTVIVDNKVYHRNEDIFYPTTKSKLVHKVVMTIVKETRDKNYDDIAIDYYVKSPAKFMLKYSSKDKLFHSEENAMEYAKYFYETFPNQCYYGTGEE